MNKGERKNWVFWLFCGFAVVGLYYALTEHRQHLFDYLPFLLLMACPLMHLFHRHGHGGHRHEDERKKKP